MNEEEQQKGDGERYNPVAIESKWRKKWDEARLFEARMEDGREHFMITVAWPYPSGAMHVGHARTYGVPDIIARYKRKKGFRVLFPMGWHMTGSPIVGASQRIIRGDPVFLKLLKDLYKVTDADLEKMKDPKGFGRYFTNESLLGYRKGMEALGYSIDWSRECTSIDPQFSKMVEWQYRILHSKGLIAKGAHPIKFCPRDNSSVVDHDLLAGEGVDIVEFTLVKYMMGDIVLPAATLRPETIWGVTNIWLHPTEDYVEALVNGEKWVVSADAAERLRFQGKTIEIKRTFKGSELAGRMVKVPMAGLEVPILPATFVDVKHTSGVVGSVPAHAPFDLVALWDLQNDDAALARYKLDAGTIKSLQPIYIIAVEGEKDLTEKTLKEKGVKGQGDKDALEECTNAVYKKEHAKGRMTVGKYAGVPVSRAKEDVKKELISNGKGDIMFEFSAKPVICRCNTECVIKMVKDQWFLRYSDEDWKEQVRSELRKMDLVPVETLTYFMNIVDWLRDWPCTRKTGLGTRLPVDTEWTIESLSDSTIYMAYYTIAHLMKTVPAEKLSDDVFEYLYHGKGDAKTIGMARSIDPGLLERMKDEYEYWYPQDYRVSANELIPNHLTFMIFHHAAVIPDRVPKGIVCPGMGILEGKKMSSSKGNIFAVHEATLEFGADVTRVYLMYMSEIWQDFDWRGAQAHATRRQMERFFKLANDIIVTKDGGPHRLDPWLGSRLQRHIEGVDIALDRFQTRRALQQAFYDISQDVRKYIAEGGSNKALLKEALDVWLNILSPFAPHICDELWERAGNPGFASMARFPDMDVSRIDEAAEATESYVDAVLADIQQIIKVTKMAPKKVVLYTAPAWKTKVLKVALKMGDGCDMKGLMAEVLKDDEVKKASKAVPKYAQKLVQDVRAGKAPTIFLDEKKVLVDAVPFLKADLGCDVLVHSGDDMSAPDPQKKKDAAVPGRPAIFLE